MGRYVDETYYYDTYKGTRIPKDEFDRIIDDAEMDIDSLTFNRIVAKRFANLTAFRQDIIKKSVCMHADFTYEYGEMINTPIASYSAGTTSVSFDKNKIVMQNGTATSNRAFNILKQSGLTVRLFL